MRGVIKKKLSERLMVFNQLQGISLSDTETLILSRIIYYSSNGSLVMDGQLIKDIRAKENIKESAFNTAINRLEKKRCFNKGGKTITLSPLYVKLEQFNEILIKFI